MQQRHPILALREPLTRGIAAPHDEMPNFALGEAEVDKLIAYINTLQSAPRGWSTGHGHGAESINHSSQFARQQTLQHEARARA